MFIGFDNQLIFTIHTLDLRCSLLVEYQQSKFVGPIVFHLVCQDSGKTTLLRETITGMACTKESYRQ